MTNGDCQLDTTADNVVVADDNNHICNMWHEERRAGERMRKKNENMTTSMRRHEIDFATN